LERFAIFCVNTRERDSRGEEKEVESMNMDRSRKRRKVSLQSETAFG
jgi:hypothetical protein